MIYQAWHDYQADYKYCHPWHCLYYLISLRFSYPPNYQPFFVTPPPLLPLLVVLRLSFVLQELFSFCRFVVRGAASITTWLYCLQFLCSVSLSEELQVLSSVIILAVHESIGFFICSQLAMVDCATPLPRLLLLSVVLLSEGLQVLLFACITCSSSSHLSTAWRCLCSLPAPTPFQTATPLQPAPVKDLRGFQTATNENDVTLSKHGKPAPVLSCSVVADKNPSYRGKGK